MNNKKLLLIISVLLFLGCYSNKEKEIILEVKHVDFIYTKPYILFNNDTKTNFQSHIFLQIECLIKNKSESSKRVLLNNLIENNYSFNIKMAIKEKKNIIFYNYPFTNKFFPVKNDQIINNADSITVNLQSPLLYYFKEINQVKIDSIFNSFRKNKFYIIPNQIKNIELIFDSSDIKYDIVPISDNCFIGINNR